MRRAFLIFFAICSTASLASCARDRDEKQRLVYEIFLQEFVSIDNLVFVPQSDGAMLIATENAKESSNPIGYRIQSMSQDGCKFYVDRQKYVADGDYFINVDPSPFSDDDRFKIDTHAVDFKDAAISQDARGITTIELPVRKGALLDAVVQRMGGTRWRQTVITDAAVGYQDKNAALKRAEAWKAKVELFRTKYCKGQE
jgi:hypothetical protein